jgi:hypothetical protein
VVVIDGEPKWWRHARGVTGVAGTFDYWEIAATAARDRGMGGRWCRKHLQGYTGMVNLETIGARIIEAHLRFADQWPDLYGGDRWVEALVRLYESGDWRFDDSAARTGFSVVLFAPHGRRYAHPSNELQQQILAMRGVSSRAGHVPRDCRLNGMPCRPAASGSRSSTAGIAPRVTRRGSACGRISKR